MRYARRLRAAGFFAVAATSLGLGFASNTWGLADQRRFERQNFGMEAHVAGRLVKSRQDGPLSAGGLLGLGTEDGRPIDWWDVPAEEQFDVYGRGGDFAAFEVYASQPGVQALLFSVLDGRLKRPPSDRLVVFRTLTAVLGGISLGLVVTWFFLEFGALTGVVVLASALASPWLTVLGGKMFWALWAFYLPLLVPMYYLRRRRTLTKTELLRFGGLVWLAVFLKTLFNGYEYITAALIMAVVPSVYYGVRGRWNGTDWRRILATTGLACVGAVGLSLALLVVQIAAARGDPTAGAEHIVDALRKRTYADPSAFSPGMGLESSTTEVLLIYLKGVWLNLNDFIRVTNEYVRWYLLRVRYGALLVGFGAASVALYLVERRLDRPEASHPRGDVKGLLAATWLSLLAPLSWFVIFKSHSFIHVGMNQVAWHMPFVLFGFAVVGCLAGRLVKFARGVDRSV